MAPLPEDPREREKVLMAKTPAAFAASRQVLCLPLYSDLPLEAVDHICALIHREKGSKKQEGRRGKESAGKGEGKDKRQEAGERGRGEEGV